MYNVRGWVRGGVVQSQFLTMQGGYLKNMSILRTSYVYGSFVGAVSELLERSRRFDLDDDEEEGV